MKAYLLIEIEPGSDLSNFKHALSQPGVQSVDLVMGEWDCICTVEVPDYATLARVATVVQKCPGIRKSVTCPVVEEGNR